MRSRGGSDGWWEHDPDGASPSDPAPGPVEESSKILPTVGALTVGWPRDRPADFSIHFDPPSSIQADRTPRGATRAVAETRVEWTSPGSKPGEFPALGEVVGGFRLVSELGRGAFARVFLAEQPALADRPVALKVSQPLGDEPQALARLQHTHIVPIYSVHDDPATGLRLLCMPYLGGANLAQVLETADTRLPTQATGRSLVEALDLVGGPPLSLDAGLSRLPGSLERAASGRFGHAITRGVGSPTLVRSLLGRRLARLPWWGRIVDDLDDPESPPPEPGQPARQFLHAHTYVQAAVWIAARLAEALEHAHSRGILHRDLKPSNVLIAADGTPMLLDFNLAADVVKPGADDDQELVGGTLPYMAPEHLEAFASQGDSQSEDVDERSDLYALGLILFEMVAGHHPFADPPEALPLIETVRRMIADRRAGAASARISNPRVPRDLDAILRKCLDPDPDRRYADAGELAEDLRRFLDNRPLKFTPEPLSAERLAKWVRRHPEVGSVSTIGGLAATLILGLGVLTWSVADHLEVASAKTHRADFRKAFDECQLALNTTSIPFGRADLEPAIDRADRVLDDYNVNDPGDWTQGALVRRLPKTEARALREEMAELILLRTRAKVLLAERGPDADRRAALNEAIGWLTLAERFDPHPPSALFEERARYHAALGQEKEAGRDQAQAARIRPKTARDFDLIGTALLARGRADAASGPLARAVALDGRRFWSWFALGLCHYDQGRFTEAAADFSVCTALAPEFAWPHLNRGLALAAANRQVEALACYDQALTLAPEFVEALVNRALTCLELNNPAQAIADLDRAEGLGLRNPSVLAARAEALARLGRRAEADDGFTRALRTRPNDPIVLVARGFFRLKTDPNAASADFRRVLSLEPGNARAQLGLAHYLRPTDPGAALVRVDLALKADPNLTDALQLRALVRARLGDPSAEADVDRLARIPTAHNLYNAACALTVLSSTTRDPRSLPRALLMLRRALDLGFPAAALDTDPDLAPLRSRPEWRELRR
ncbi:MAG: protein kinase [Isosphaeraceae bacterium]